MTISEAFEGETSSLRKTFDEVVARESKDTWRERWDKLEPVHRVGSHSDDWGGSSDNLCFCEIKDFIQQEIDRAVKEREEAMLERINGMLGDRIYTMSHGYVSRESATEIKNEIINNLK